MANVGTSDRTIRGVVGAILIALPFLTSFALWGNPLFSWGVPLIGLVLVLTAVFSFCPAYRLLGMNTCGLKR
jgi:hypothetical protein